LLFSPVISEHFSKNRMIISVVAAKIWHLQKCTVFIGPPCTWRYTLFHQFAVLNLLFVNFSRKFFSELKKFNEKTLKRFALKKKSVNKEFVST